MEIVTIILALVIISILAGLAVFVSNCLGRLMLTNIFQETGGEYAPLLKRGLINRRLLK